MNPIIAISTSNQNSAIGIIRISFGDKLLLNDLNLYFLKIFKKKLIPRYATFVKFFYKDKVLDSGIAIFFSKPFSYTGEHVLEYQGHGNYLNLSYILKVFLFFFKKTKIRLAKNGEFSKRAFINKKINIIDVYNILSLFKSCNFSSLNFVHYNFTNNLYLKFNKIYNLILNIKNKFLYSNICLIKIKYKMYYIFKKILEIYKNIKYKFNIKMYIIILGYPNTGKSTLINKLSNEKVSIVSSIPGTTRDLVSKILIFNNTYVYIYDTAGLRTSSDKLENIGMKNIFNKLINSDIILYILDYNFNIKKYFIKVLKFIKKRSIFFILFNKVDLYKEFVSLELFVYFDFNNVFLKISAKFNLGVNFLYVEFSRLFFLINNNTNNNINNINFIRNIYKSILNINICLKKNHSNFLFDKINFLITYFENVLFFNKKYKLNNLFKSFCIGK